MTTINKIVLGICLTCVFLATVLGFIMIWTDVSPDVAWRCVVTLGLFFCSSLLAGGVVSLFTKKEQK